MKKLILAFLFLVVSCFAQQTNTVYLQLATGLTSLPSQPYNITNNVGQTFHTFSVTLSGGSCSSYPLWANFNAYIEVSYDGSIYNAIPQVGISYENAFQSSFGNQNAVKFYRAAGAYPYIRFRVVHFPTTLPTNCSVSINYTGSLYSNPISDAIFNVTVTASDITTTCKPLTVGSGADTDNTYPVDSLISLISSATNEVDIYSNTTCAGTPYLTIYGPGSFSVPLSSTNSPLLYIFHDVSGNVGLSAKSASGTSSVIAEFALVN